MVKGFDSEFSWMAHVINLVLKSFKFSKNFNTAIKYIKTIACTAHYINLFT